MKQMNRISEKAKKLKESTYMALKKKYNRYAKKTSKNQLIPIVNTHNAYSQPPANSNNNSTTQQIITGSYVASSGGWSGPTSGSFNVTGAVFGNFNNVNTPPTPPPPDVVSVNMKQSIVVRTKVPVYGWAIILSGPARVSALNTITAGNPTNVIIRVKNEETDAIVDFTYCFEYDEENTSQIELDETTKRLNMGKACYVFVPTPEGYDKIKKGGNSDSVFLII